MARYNEILVGRINRRFQKHLSMKGEPPAPQLASEIQPSLQIFTGIEERYLEGFDRFGLAVSNNVVGQSSAWRLRNPVNSGVIVVLESLQVNLSANGSINVLSGSSTTDENVVASQANPWRLDARGRRNASAIVSFNNAAPASTVGLNSFWVVVASGTTMFQLISDSDHQLPVLPGDLIAVAFGP